ncbi:hypothetical protein MmiEs2_09110 [Methanimicrococcus stummii]|uniref:Uncharacterized protein n=1 Tax=Methanimicrococcus stummii TaxID=3028294 RepID=A0AA96V9L1_9EURY|nr:hypothetical protein [Methanimicrococcus sp. Es2]WNY28708.1 hypothetical protein MmiEs2_09110 [Methanimicrococcus sp. Es2]
MGVGYSTRTRFSTPAGLDAEKPPHPQKGNVYIATDTEKQYVCYETGVWKDGLYPDADGLMRFNGKPLYTKINSSEGGQNFGTTTQTVLSNNATGVRAAATNRPNYVTIVAASPQTSLLPADLTPEKIRAVSIMTSPTEVKELMRWTDIIPRGTYLRGFVLLPAVLTNYPDITLEDVFENLNISVIATSSFSVQARWWDCNPLWGTP